jgi:TrmH family RNA methyltransferase
MDLDIDDGASSAAAEQNAAAFRSMSARREARAASPSDLPGIEDQFRAARSDPELALLEGFHAVKHAIRFGAELLALVGTDAAAAGGLADALAPDLRNRFAASLRVVSPETFANLAPRPPRTGLLGIARRPHVDVSAALASPEQRPVVLLEDPRNLGNIGACVRVAAAADAEAVLTTGAQDPWRPEVLRGAAGLHFALPVVRITEPGPHDRQLIAIDPTGDPFDPVRMHPRAILAFGTERHGIGERLLARAEHRMSIPMRPGVSSLNLATSVAAVLFAWRLTRDRSPSTLSP